MNVLKRPMFFAASTCFIAAALSIYFKTLAFIFLALVLAFFTILLCRKKYKYLAVVLAILLFTVGLSFQHARLSDVEHLDEQSLIGEFLVAEEPEAFDEFTKLTLMPLRAELLPKNFKIVAFDYKKTQLKMGEIVNADITLSAIDAYDDFRIQNISDGIYASATIDGITQSDKTNLFYKTAGQIRSYVKNGVSKFFDGDAKGLLLALTIGDKSFVEDDFASKIKTTGISHVIVVSGMHLSIIMMAVFWLLDKLFYNKYVRSLVSIVFVIIIFAVCGFTMSMTRAGLMFIIVGLSSVFNRDNDSLSSLFTAITTVLIFSPFAALNVSFLLSVFSTLAIIWAVPFYYQLLTMKFNISSKFLSLILGTFLCSAFAIIFTLPITIKTFGFASIVAPITNMLITFPITIALISNILALVIGAIPIVEYLSYLLYFIAGLCTRFTTFVVDVIAKLPITVAVLPKVAFWWSVILIAFVVGYMYYHEYKKKRSELYANNF